MFATRKIAPEEAAELERIEALVRARYGLAEGDLVIVSAEAPRDPGFPPRATTVLFWAGITRHRLRLFLAPGDVTAGAMPPGWLRSALIDDGEGDCC